MGQPTLEDLRGAVEARRSEVDGLLREIYDRFDEILGLSITVGWANGFYVEVMWITPDDKHHEVEGETLIGALRTVLTRLEDDR